MTEDQLGAWLLEIAHLGGWRAVHWRPASNQRGHWSTNYQGDGRGFPDWLLLRGSDLIAAELERELKAAPPEQIDYLTDFSRIERCRSFVWRPSNREEIAAILTGQRAQLTLL